MESLKGIVESIEAEFGESIVARDESTIALSSTSGLGPPDLCWLQKSPISTLTGAVGEPRGFYHHTLGRDVSSSAAVAAYFASITTLVEPIPFLKGLWLSSETRIQRGFFCTFDPFTRMDVRCELCVPGGVVCGALDPAGAVHDVTPALWRNVQVAGFLRAEMLDPDLLTHAGDSLRRYVPVPSPPDERQLLSHVVDMYRSKTLPAALDRLTQDQNGGCTAEHMDLLLFTLLRHFGRRQRWEAALDFFARLADVYGAAAVYVAAVQREMGQYDDSLRTLSAAVEMDPHAPQLLIALACECLHAQQLDTAVKLARRAVRMDSNLRPAWLVLARCYVRLEQPSLALVTLNVVPTPPVPPKEEIMLHVVVPPKPRGSTKPVTVPYDPDIIQAKQILEEEISMTGKRTLAYLPAAGMVNREPSDLGLWPDVGPNRLTRAVLAAVYGVLQELVALLGWDAFLAFRSRVFVMHAETEAGGAVAAPSPPPQQAPRMGGMSATASLAERQAQQQQDAMAAPPSQQTAGGKQQAQHRDVINQQQPQQPGDEGGEEGEEGYGVHGVEGDHAEGVAAEGDEVDEERLQAEERQHLYEQQLELSEQQQVDNAIGSVAASLEALQVQGGLVEAGPPTAISPEAGLIPLSDPADHPTAAPVSDPNTHTNGTSPHAELASPADAAAATSTMKAAAAGATSPTSAGSVFTLRSIKSHGPNSNTTAAANTPAPTITGSITAATPAPPSISPLQEGGNTGSAAAVQGSSTAAAVEPLLVSAAAWSSVTAAPTGHRPPMTLTFGARGKAKPIAEGYQEAECSSARLIGGSHLASVRFTSSREPRNYDHHHHQQQLLQQLQWSALSDYLPCHGALLQSAGSCLHERTARPRLHAAQLSHRKPTRQRKRRHAQPAGSAMQLMRSDTYALQLHAAAASCHARLQWQSSAAVTPSVQSLSLLSAELTHAADRIQHPWLSVQATATSSASAEVRLAAINTKNRSSKRRPLTALLQLLQWRSHRKLTCHAPSQHPLPSAALSASCSQLPSIIKADAGDSHCSSNYSLPAAVAAHGSPYSPTAASFLLASSHSHLAHDSCYAHAAARQPHNAMCAVQRQQQDAREAVARSLAGYVTSCTLSICHSPTKQCDAGSAWSPPSPVYSSAPLPACAAVCEAIEHAVESSSTEAAASAAAHAANAGSADSALQAAAEAAAAATAAAAHAANGTRTGGGEAGRSSAGGLAPSRSTSLSAGGAGSRRGSGGGHNLGMVQRNYDADRESAILGREPAMGDVHNKRLCVRWLDELIVALWHDLQAYMEWKQLDTELMRTRGRPHAGIILGWRRNTGGSDGESDYDDDDDDDPLQPPLPDLSSRDWMRRGLLAERLYHDEDALLAYSASLQLGFSVTAWLGLLRLAAMGDDVQLVLRGVHELMLWQDRQLPLNAQPVLAAGSVPGSHIGGPGAASAPALAPATGKAGAPPPPRAPGCPTAVLAAVCSLIAVSGADAVASAQDVIGPPHPALLDLVDGLAMWTEQQAALG